MNHLRIAGVWTILAAIAVSGCSRSFYRRQADREVYALVDCVADDPRWPLDNYTIQVDPRSRMFDPFPADCPPMPPDDPTSHRLMHCVDGKTGYPGWHINGDTATVENPDWMNYLARGEDGRVTMDMRDAVQTALLHSSRYQQELEDLYLSALDVTFERFRFDAQFFGGNSTFFTADGRLRTGGASSSLLTSDTDLEVRRLTATGGELAVGLANSLVWQFSGDNTHTATTLLDFTLVQPLLRAGGRPRVLERLTLAERTLLGNVRQMEHYRRGFYADVVTGRDAGDGPNRRGGFFGSSGLEGFAGVGGGGFGRVGGGQAGPAAGGETTGGAGAAQAGGFLGLLQDQQQIRNRQANVSALQESLAQLEASHLAGRIDRFQVDLARQALYNAQSLLLTNEASNQSSEDRFKVRIGLPPEMDVRFEDSLLAQFDLISPPLRSAQMAISGIQVSVGQQIIDLRQSAAGGLDENRIQQELTTLRERLALAKPRHQEVVNYFPNVREDLVKLRAAIGPRERNLRALIARIKEANETFDVSLLDPEPLLKLGDKLESDMAMLETRLGKLPEELDKLDAELAQLQADAPSLKGDALRQRMTVLVERIPDRLAELSTLTLELTLIQARARTETVTVTAIRMTPQRASEIAMANRRDVMNARASLVDAWRLVEFNANALKSDVNITLNGDISTVGDNPVKFRSPTGRLQAGVEIDAPLTRLSERNVYRQALIEYQQARRAYYQFIDRVNLSLRNVLRTIELNELNFELRRGAVRVAIDQVELVRLRLAAPPDPVAGATFNNSTARDLVSALSDLLNVQNDFLSVWVNYEVQRLGLDFELGTMELDGTGIWMDPGGAIGSSGGNSPAEQCPADDAPPDMPIQTGASPPTKLSAKTGEQDTSNDATNKDAKGADSTNDDGAPKPK